MNKPELSNLVVHRLPRVSLCVVASHMELEIEGVCCDNHETNMSCIGVAAMECVLLKDDNGKHKKVRVSDRITNGILEEIKFTY